MKSIATAVFTINVPFHGAELYVVNHNGEPYTPMKPIVEGMGMTWQSQHRKLMERFKTCIIEMMIQLPGDTQRRLVICLALRKLAGWLQTISPNKVRPEIRDKVIQYQEECDDVLYEYWTKGHVVNPRKAKKALPGKITKEQQEAIKQLVMSRGQSLPKEKQAKAMITMWSSLKSHFGCSYKEIREEQFTEALSLAARVPLEGEFIGKSKHNEMSCFDWRMNVHNLNSACIHLDAMYRIWRDEMEPALRLLGSPVATRFCGRIADCYSVTASVKKSLEDAAGLKGLQPF
ncbi:phage antirepressor N-terminal domain-containing protein [Escherichia coli]|nr:phage antirepressor N-terminal domain-containing protein [Escherichia coli]MCZ4981212.1 phage antirepressor N-terminal domain-containing protein [Escherichia coli]MCZ5159896.1 phage antirepressor N-terminal domain-containing protein [Escherichia coli]MCZ5250399.1 phage antirepressor N-terminal domain-containing protein [Escherichia coli]MCZ5432990.1 phage antirepressor N-terminal domain-containing protein [Escherichia coli]